MEFLTCGSRAVVVGSRGARLRKECHLESKFVLDLDRGVEVRERRRAYISFFASAVRGFLLVTPVNFDGGGRGGRKNAMRVAAIVCLRSRRETGASAAT